LKFYSNINEIVAALETYAIFTVGHNCIDVAIDFQAKTAVKA